MSHTQRSATIEDTMFPRRQHHYLYLLVLSSHLLLSRSTIAAASEVSAIIVFGDSTVDAGNNVYNPFVSRGSLPPYGRDFNGGVPTGRFSNGRIIPDFISEGLGLPSTVPAYFDTTNTVDRLSTGANFASSGAGLDDLTSEFFMAIPLRQQIESFREYKERLTLAMGESDAGEIIAEAVYYFGIGNNDIGVNYFFLPERRAQFSPPGYVAFLIDVAGAAVREVFELGGRKIQLTGVLPVGCVPAMRTANTQRPGECVEELNQYAVMFNAELRKAVDRLNAELAGARLVYGDLYGLVSAIVANPSEYGFENVKQGCCGTGLVEMSFLCALDAPLSCQDAEKYLFFDSAHFTERVHKMEAMEMLSTSLAVFM